LPGAEGLVLIRRLKLEIAVVLALKVAGLALLYILFFLPAHTGG